MEEITGLASNMNIFISLYNWILKIKPEKIENFKIFTSGLNKIKFKVVKTFANWI